MLAEVYLLQTNSAVGGKYTYSVPEHLRSDVAPGVVVKAPFGLGNGLKSAVVWNVYADGSEPEVKYKLKDIASINTDQPRLTAKEMALAEKMSRLCLCPVGDCARCMLPPEGGKGQLVNWTELLPYDEAEAEKLKNISQIKFLNYLKECGGKAQSAEVIQNINGNPGTPKSLEKKGFIRIYKDREATPAISDEAPVPYPAQELTGDQRLAYDRLAEMLDAGGGKALLHGVTGSGKTEIYLQLAEKVISAGGNAIILVPEISLTPQMTARFAGRFGKDIAILHSRLTDGERNRQWKRIKSGEVKLAVGARSAVFAPFEKVSLIVIDEEQELTYKSDENPRYHAADLAALRCSEDGALLVFGSATPSIERYYQAEHGILEMIELPDRVNSRPLPHTELVDMKEELAAGEKGILSRRLVAEMQKNLDAGEQTMLFINRRGFSGHVICTSCGKSMKCGKCNIPMTYHSGSGRLVCHYCGNTAPMPLKCPGCGRDKFSRKAFGTQRVEEELATLFPEAKVVRMDADTTSGKDGHAKVLDDFLKGGGDIMVGTQMIAKGHDFPNVTLVGVLSADSLINAQDYRATERAFQLITQVAGRAGRGEKPGRVLIQAYDLDNYALETALRQDYQAFYRQEIKLRESLYYPPFCCMAVVGVTGDDDRAVFEYGVSVRKKLSSLAADMFKKEDDVEVMGITRASVPKLNNKYRWRILVKAPTRRKVLELLNAYLNAAPRLKNHVSGVIIDINPGNMY